MDTLMLVLSIIIILCSILLIAIILFQKGRDPGMSGAVTGSSSGNFYNKNRSATREEMLKRATVVASIVFIVAILVLNIIELM